ncbi:MAG: hypothetical protein U1F59_11780 [Candidatus Competibacteraceae bacterium]
MKTDVLFYRLLIGFRLVFEGVGHEAIPPRNSNKPFRLDGVLMPRRVIVEAQMRRMTFTFAEIFLYLYGPVVGDLSKPDIIAEVRLIWRIGPGPEAVAA